MAEKTPQTEALTSELLGSDEKLVAFKSDPEPQLKDAGVAVTPDELIALQRHLAGHDHDAIKMTLANSGLHTMLSERA
jgi:hypothetical protein